MPITPARKRPATGSATAGSTAPMTVLRRTLALTLAALLALFVSPVVAPAGPASAQAVNHCGMPDFPDVPKSSSHYGAIAWMACTGLTVGYGDGTFRLSRDITRGEAAAFLHRQVDPDHSADPVQDFSDVDPGGTYFAAISWMVDEGITVGRAEGTFGIREPITRGELAAFIHRIAGTGSPAPARSPFTDLSSGSTHYRAITWLAAQGITHGYADGSFRPQQPVSRGETASFLARADVHLVGTGRGPVPPTFTVRGSGWGHGVGMSQYGARAMAADGHSAARILDFYYGPATVGTTGSRAAQDIRVHLHTTARTTLDGTGRVRVRDVGTTSGAVELAVQGDRVVVALPNGTTQTVPRAIVEWEGTRFWAGRGASTLRVPQADGGSRPLDLRHGRLVVSVVDGRLNIVNTLRMNDEYLYGLGEMPASWPAAALQAQAIASRSYALRSMGTVKAECDCHLWDEVRSQKFLGWGQEGIPTWGARWAAAVDATVTRSTAGVPVRAQGLFYRGAVIDATYYSSNGGHTRDSGDVWSGATVPYLTARPDPYSTSAAADNPNASWTKTITQADLKRVFGLDDVVTVRLAHGADGTPATMTATSRDGRVSRVTGRDVRAQFGLKSAWVSAIIPNHGR